MALVFRLLALDPERKTHCENALDLLHLLRGYTGLWKKPKLSELESCITDGELKLTAEALEGEAHGASMPDDLGRAYLLAITGSYPDVEPLREPLASFLKYQKFEQLYVLRDEVSEHIACKLYPHLYRIENLLRGYLIRFLATHIGPQWWDRTASSEMATKAKARKKNELVFGKHVDNGAYLIDFDELGQIVYEYSSGFLTREDIVERISSLAETPDAIRALKQELQSNYYKLFKESFAEKKFKEKWKQFESLRNKIAHNNLFTAEDLATGERLALEITDIIIAADAEVAKLVITTEEREAIKEQIIARSPAKEITEEVFLGELDAQEEYYSSRKAGFVGLNKFINSHLGFRGYSYHTSWEMLQQMKERRLIEIYYVPNPNDDENPTAAIRRTPSSAPTSAV